VTAGETVGAGDAENDLPFLAVCGVGCACGDALPEVRARTACYAENIAELARRLV
jgi:hydroxymethylpyrimidine pyrophosphatase-like HAD family hydrolase